MTSRGEVLRSAAWFPGVAFTGAGVDDAKVGAKLNDTQLSTNGFLSSLLEPEDREKLREINVALTRAAMDQCLAGGGAANQIDFGTLICLSVAELTAHGVSSDELLDLSAKYDVVFPWSLQYGNVRTPFNIRLVRLPLAIAFPRTVEDVQFWVNFVRCHELTVSVRSGNNSYEGLSSSNEVILDLTFLELRENVQFDIDKTKSLVHVAPGVRLGVLYTELGREKYILAGGQCAPVCVGGLVGTGGIGFSTRRFGWACDQLEEVEYVLADGSIVKANAHNEYADLYRATKGAGGLGVMTRLTLRLEPAVQTLWYSIVFNLTEDEGLLHGAKILAEWQHLSLAPKELSSTFAATAAGDGSGTLTIHGTYRVEHDAANGESRLRDILKEYWLAKLPVEPDVFLVLDDLDSGEVATATALIVPMPYFTQWKLKSIFTYRNLSEEELRPVFAYLTTHAAADDPAKGVGYFNQWLMGGRSNEIDPESAVVPAREGAVMWIHSGAQWNDESVAAQALAFVDGMWEKIDNAAQSSSAFYGCPDLQLGSQLTHPPDIGYARAYWSSPTHDFVPFLVAVKNKYDQKDLFKFAQSIPLKV